MVEILFQYWQQQETPRMYLFRPKAVLVQHADPWRQLIPIL